MKSHVRISDENSVVSCGGDKFATACDKCKNAEAGCKGECLWIQADGKCVSPSKNLIGSVSHITNFAGPSNVYRKTSFAGPMYL